MLFAVQSIRSTAVIQREKQVTGTCPTTRAMHHVGPVIDNQLAMVPPSPNDFLVVPDKVCTVAHVFERERERESVPRPKKEN